MTGQVCARAGFESAPETGSGSSTIMLAGALSVWNYRRTLETGSPMFDQPDTVCDSINSACKRMEQCRMRIATWNVNQRRGRETAVDLCRLLDEDLRADVITLQ